MLTRDSSAQPEVLAIVVLYKTSIAQSPTCISIRTQEAYSSEAISVLIYDNSPTASSEGLQSGWTYISDPTNKGLAAAYNYGLSQAKRLGVQWLLLLDQDSCLPVDFIASLQNEIAHCHKDSKIAAIVPLVFSNQRQISPIRPLLGLDRPFKLTDSAPSLWLMAINSAAAVRVSFMDSIAGFSNDFWLDYLDHWLFRKIYDTGHSVYVSNMRIEHNLSVANFNQGLEVARYRGILRAEANFTNQCLPIYWRPLLALRLVARAAKHAVFTRNKKMALVMLLAACKQTLAILYRQPDKALSDR
jgi:GT2 family glycosyltransferase